ncbi:MAG: prepilin-type N-terminal cleavage/methylation domain-containing protein [Candidatus Saccharibacteria bacterium]|nr:prepilin-type N-terminal cleavage/methylation domain-containing protein [Candidatus Saccharibacteria bacterium]
MFSCGNKPKDQKKLLFSSAFTLIELIVVVTIIAILATIGVVGYNSWRQATATAQLKSDLNSVATAMEDNRNFNNKYPATIPSTFNPTTGVTLSGGSDDGGLTFCVSAVNSQFPSLSFHIDSTNNGPQPGVCATQKLLATYAGTGGTVSPGGTYASNSVQTITATPSQYYRGLGNNTNVWTGDSGCAGGGNILSHTITMDTKKDCTANFEPIPIVCVPSAPTVTHATVAGTTTFSWTPGVCGGASTRYQYRYTISPSGFDSGWISTASPSAAFTTTTEGQTYSLDVQTQFYNPATSTAWGPTGTDGWFFTPTIPVITCTTASSSSVNCSWTSNPYATNYSMDRATNSSFTTGLTTITQAGTTYTSTGLAQGTTYYFRSKTNLAGSSSAYSPYDTATTTVDICNVPVDNYSTVGATTTWTWSAPTCPPGTSARYRYDYTIAPIGFDSGWTSTASTSVAFTTSTEGQTYCVALQAQAYTGSASSAWTASDTDCYLRGIPTPTITATTASSTSVNVSWTSDAYATSYTMDRATNSSFTTGLTTITQAGTTYTSTGLNEGVTYYFRVNSNLPAGPSADSPYGTATTTITTPTPNPPTTTDNTVGATTTWTFSAETCAGGTTLEYRYDYTIVPPPLGSGGYDSGWMATSASSVAFTTSTEGKTYNVVVQARCYTGATTSSWTSSSANNTYYRIINYYLTLAGSNCTFSQSPGMGPYPEGSAATMTCTPTATNYFDHWSGDTGCTINGGTDYTHTASHTITMDSNKSCVALSSHWIYADVGGQIGGKYVWYKDLSAEYAYKVNNNADNNTWTVMGGDSSHPNQRVLRDPNTAPGNTLDWASWYPSQYRCNSSLGGRVPNNGELAGIIANKSLFNQDYGFGTLDDWYGSSNEATDYDTTISPVRNRITDDYGDRGKTGTAAIRCIADNV